MELGVKGGGYIRKDADFIINTLNECLQLWQKRLVLLFFHD